MKQVLILLLISINLYPYIGIDALNNQSIAYGQTTTLVQQFNGIEDYNIKVVLNKSYVMRYKAITKGTYSYYLYMARDYMVLNIDNDEYPDYLIWYPQRLVIWSLGRGVYSQLYIDDPSLYFNRPIPIDSDHDGVIDYILVIENDYMDARIRPYSEINSIKTRIYIWYPLNNYARYFNEYRRVSIRSETCYIYGSKLFLPWLLNYYVSSGYDYKVYYSRIGLTVFDIKRFTIRIYTLKTYSSGKVYDPSDPDTCDYTTNYEAYITGIYYRLFIIPSGLDKVLDIRYYSSGYVKIYREYSIGDNKWNDDQIVIGRGFPAIPFGGYTKTPLTLDYYWRSPQRLSFKYKYGYLFLPIGRFIYLNPTRSESGVFFRVEKITGVVVLDVYNNRIYTRNLVGTTVKYNGKTYSVIAVTTIDFDNTGSYIYYGGLAYGNGYWLFFINKYYWRTIKIYSIWVKFIGAHLVKNKFQVTLRLDNQLYGVSLNTLYVDGEEYVFHTPVSSGRTPQYTVYPPVTLNPLSIDIDDDGVDEYCFLMYYTKYSPYSYTIHDINGMYPMVLNGVNYIVWFDKPVIYMYLKGIDDTNHVMDLKIYYYATDISYGRIYVKEYYSGKTIYQASFRGNELFVDEITINEPGRYRVDLEVYTRYEVNEWITGGYVPYTISYREYQNNVYSFYVRYRTRILLEKPETNILTPNLYRNGLTIVFKLEYQDFITSYWKPLTTSTALLYVIVSNNNDTVEGYPEDIGNGLYSYIAYDLKPGGTEIYLKYYGDQYHLPMYTSIQKKLIKYPVVINMTYNKNIPALTPYNLTVNLYYRYVKENGIWKKEKLDHGYIEASIYNLTVNKSLIHSVGINVTSYRCNVSIDKYLVLPGKYLFNIKYISNNIFYDNAIYNDTYTVDRLGYNVSLYNMDEHRLIYNESIVFRGSILYIRFSEHYGNISRDLSVYSGLTIYHGNNTYRYIINKTYILIDTSGWKPGNYTLVFYPLNYTYIYVPRKIIYVLSIVLSDIGLVIKAEPVVSPSSSLTSLDEFLIYNDTSYTLVPVEIKLSIETNYTDLLKNSNITIIIDGYRYKLNSFNESLTWIPLRPGYKKIVCILENKYYRIVNYTFLTVYPIPVKIIVRKGSIVIDTRDLLNRSAPGEVFIEIYGLDRKLVYNSVFYINGTLHIDVPRLNGYYYIYVYYRGNESYMEAEKLVYMYFSENDIVQPLPEPFNGVVILISLTTIILLKKRRG